MGHYRQEQQTDAFQKAYARRSGIEGTISQAIRLTGMRRNPYRGEKKTHLHHLQIATGINVLRLITHLCAQAQDQPTRPQRSLSPFARFKEEHQAIGSDV